MMKAIYIFAIKYIDKVVIKIPDLKHEPADNKWSSALSIIVWNRMEFAQRHTRVAACITACI